MFELNEHTIEIMGKPNFACGPIAHLMQKVGKDVPRKAEAEQAHVIHWLLGLYEQHGSKWRDEADKQIDEWVKQAISHETARS